MNKENDLSRENKIANAIGQALTSLNDIANKAEVDLDAGFLQWVHDRLRFVHGENENVDYMHKLRAIIASVPPGRNTPNVASIATPPATTGASTAPDRHPWFCVHCQAGVPNVHVTYEEFHDPRAGGCGYRVGDWPEKVAASTVLTDERILRISEETALNYVTDERRPDNSTIIEFAREIEREVAAQAGQVAVPEGFVLVPVKPTPKMVDATFNHSQEKFGTVESHNTRNKRIYAAMLAAAPSPAKESK